MILLDNGQMKSFEDIHILIRTKLFLFEKNLFWKKLLFEKKMFFE